MKEINKVEKCREKERNIEGKEDGMKRKRKELKK